MIVPHPDLTKGVTIFDVWNVLGPFQIGTREAVWGADPLECYGGFRSLVYNPTVHYSSSLSLGGRAYWSQHIIENDISHSKIAKDPVLEPYKATLNVAFPQIDWRSLQAIYGYAAIQWQAWARGRLKVTGSAQQTILLYIENALEYWIDGTHFFGADYYAFRRAPLVLHLAAGEHSIEVRLVRDVRLFGAASRPTFFINIEARVSKDSIIVDSAKAIFPETVNKKLAGRFFSVPVTNLTQAAIFVQSLAVYDDCVGQEKEPTQCRSLQKLPMHIAPGQSRPLSLRLCSSDLSSCSLSLIISHSSKGKKSSYESQCLHIRLPNKDTYEPHRITYLHPSGTVSSAILRPPAREVCGDLSPQQSLPIALVLHGAGFDINSEEGRRLLYDVPDLPAWVLIPSGATTWASDDWHLWGLEDIEAAIDAIPNWARDTGTPGFCSYDARTPKHFPLLLICKQERQLTLRYDKGWKGPSANLQKWLVIGHSNGGQGVWHCLSMRPDKIIGAAPVSAYTSIQAYVPYQMWSEADPRVSLCIQNALRNARHEALVDNFCNIPIFLQHSSDDDNVPVFHARRMQEIVSQKSNSDIVYSELDGKGHWFDGVLTTPQLCLFYKDILSNPYMPVLPTSFSVCVSDPASMGSRGGVRVDLLEDPDQMGSISVTRHTQGSTCHYEVLFGVLVASRDLPHTDANSDIERRALKTSNVSAFNFVATAYSEYLPQSVIVDGRRYEQLPRQRLLTSYFAKDMSGTWTIMEHSLPVLGSRQGMQLGPLTSILRTRDNLVIRYLSPVCYPIALQTARNLFQYYAADAEISGGSQQAAQREHFGNVVTVGIGRDTFELDREDRPVKITSTHVEISRTEGECTAYEYEEGMGAIYLSPLSEQRLELVIWGIDEAGLRAAGRLFPMLTGVGQPEFIIVGRKCTWKGAAGVLAMGSFTNAWKASRASFIS